MRPLAVWIALLLVGACTEAAATRERTTLEPVAPGGEVDAAPLSGSDAAAQQDAARAEAGERDAGAEPTEDAARAASESEGDAALPHDAGEPEGDAASAAMIDAAAPVDAAAIVCAIAVDETGLAGVRIRIEGDRCTFRSGEGGNFRYHVELARPIPYQVADGFGGCGLCGGYGAEPGSLLRATVEADGIRYCATCDVGCCPPDLEARHELAQGTTEGTLEWPGRTWNGPSDTTAPLGPAFPPGSYAVKVSLRVPGVGTASAQLPITVAP